MAWNSVICRSKFPDRYATFDSSARPTTTARSSSRLTRSVATVNWISAAIRLAGRERVEVRATASTTGRGELPIATSDQVRVGDVLVESASAATVRGAPGGLADWISVARSELG
nr:hypothetical protein GCM10025732_00140 [Glycomyces mayteni]